MSKFKVGDAVKTIVSPFSNEEVEHGFVIYVQPKDKVAPYIAPYIVDFGEQWRGLMEHQLRSEDE